MVWRLAPGFHHTFLPALAQHSLEQLPEDFLTQLIIANKKDANT
jgi:hypothetical protein